MIVLFEKLDVVTITFDDDSFTIVEHVPWAE
jgi:hypothetical protein